MNGCSLRQFTKQPENIQLTTSTNGIASPTITERVDSLGKTDLFSLPCLIIKFACTMALNNPAYINFIALLA